MFESSNYSFWLHLHLACVTASVTFFILRFAGVLAHQTWPLNRIPRLFSVLIDSVLLFSGVSLWVIMHHNPVHESWLAIKLFLLLTYIVLGSFALKRAKTYLSKWLFFALSLTVIFGMVLLANFRPTIF